MKKLFPGKIKPISFTLVALVVIVTALVTNFLFSFVLEWQLERIENATRSTETAFSSEDNADVEQMFDSENKSAYFVNDAEREFVERTVMAEAGGEGIRGMEAVAQVIHNRSVLWNMTPVEVVTQPYQFATYSGEITEECRLAVSNVFDLGVRVFDENVTHFHSGDEPYWTANKESRGMVGGHKFYY